MQSAGKEHETIYEEFAERAQHHLAWCVEWFPEALPLEDKYGLAMRNLVQEALDFHTSFPREQTYIVGAKDRQSGASHRLQVVSPPAQENILVFPDSLGVCDGIIKNAPTGRIGHVEVVKAPLSELSQDEVESLLNDREGGWDMVVFGASIGAPESCAVHHVIERDALVSRLYFWILQTIARDDDRRSCRRIAVVTRGTFEEKAEVHEEAGLGLITNHTVFGMTNTARLELNIPIQYIDTDYYLDSPWWSRQFLEQPAGSLLERISAECFRLCTFGQNSVRILHKGRYVMRQLPVDREYRSEAEEFPMPQEGIIMISGGNGALALVMGGWILRKCEEQGVRGIEIRFISRSCKITDRSMSAWKEIQRKANQQGVTVAQCQGDFSSQASVDSIVQSANGKMAGFIHSAGVLKDSVLQNLTWEMFEGVYDPKHRAALYLHDALERFEQPLLKFFWMFSSVAVYGNAGQTNYSGSNSFLDALARHRRGLGRPGLAIQWGPWGEVGMAANLDEASKKRWEAGPFPPFTNTQGLAGMESGLQSGLAYFTVFRSNPTGMSVMIQKNKNTTDTYQRNFYCEVFPTPLPEATLEFLYTIYRHVEFPYRRTKKEKLVHDAYVKQMKAKLNELDEDGLQWD